MPYQFIDLTTIIEMTDNDTSFMLELLSDYQRDFPEDLGKLQAAVDSANWSEIRELAHKMKSAAYFLGMMALGDGFKSLEAMAREQAKNIDIAIQTMAKLNADAELAMGDLNAAVAELEKSI